MIYDMKTLSNSELTIKVSPHGAELCSILHDGKEYLWQADPAFWKRHSPVLFPIVGSVWENEYRHEGVSYALTQHGFARDMDFELMLELEDEVRYRLVDSEETRKKYPFPFCLETVSYTHLDVYKRQVHNGVQVVAAQCAETFVDEQWVYREALAAEGRKSEGK